MRHLKLRYRLNRTTSHRQAMLKNMCSSLFRYERIVTTITKSRLLVPFAERLITRAKVDNVANRRLVASRLGHDQEVLRKLFTEIAPKFAERPGGYTRVVKLLQRETDATLMVAVELVEKISAPTIEEKAVEKEKKTEKKGKVQTQRLRKAQEIGSRRKREREKKKMEEEAAERERQKKIRPGKRRKIGETID